ncbi:hypothetical protein E4K72_00440, partial [Oxalobacteraceae bacterium OM1]
MVAQILAQIDRWNDSLETELRQMARALLGFPAVLHGIAANLSDPAEHGGLAKALLKLAGVFAISIGLEWALQRALRRPRHALILHAGQLESEIDAPAGVAGTQAPRAPPAEGDTSPDLGTAEGAAKSAAMHPPVDGVALAR